MSVQFLEFANIHPVLNRMCTALDGHISLEPSVLTRHISVVAEDYVPQHPDTWLAAARFTQHRRRIHMRYRRFDGQTGEYTVDPVHVAAYHGEWYLLAHNAKRGKIVSFAMSRILSIEGRALLAHDASAR